MGYMSAEEDRRNHLLARIHDLEGQLATARAELAAFDSTEAQRARARKTPEQRTSPSPKAPPSPPPETTHPVPNTPATLLAPPPVTADSPVEDKIALFMARFVGRTDVYATRWVRKTTGKQGWGPALRNKYQRQPTPNDFLPFTASVVDTHLRRSVTRAGQQDQDAFHAGIYPMLPGDQCQLLVCDFDDGNWKSDATAYVNACNKAGIDVLAEVSRSGSGAHVWMFLEEPMSAARVRAAGMSLLRSAMATNPNMNFNSYDRFFPAQDTLFKNQRTGTALGNLIALPLQGDCRTRGTTVFVNPETWEPYADQFAALSSTQPTSKSQISALAGEEARASVGPTHELQPRPRRAELRANAKQHADKAIRLRTDAMVHIPEGDLPGNVLTALKHVASIANPEFFRRQASRISTFGVPRYVTCFEDEDGELRIPRGLEDEARQILEDAGFTVTVSRPRKKRPRIDVTFTGTLRPEQKKSVTRLSQHRTGVLVAPPGAGKTVIACALIARRKVPTAIIVNRTELLEQWRNRLQEFLTIEEKQIGQLGGGRRKRKGQIDLITLQSLSSRTGDPSVLEEYGQIIIDECHSVAAPAAEAALRQVNAPHWVGLTATPYRADRMDGLITMQCGPIRHTMETESTRARQLHIHKTEFTTLETRTDGPSIQAIYGELAADPARNALIVSKVTTAVNEGRRCLVLTSRLDHLDKLSESIPKGTDAPVVSLHGRLTPATRRAVRQQLADLVESGDPFVLVAMDKVAGEGLDLPTLDTIFLAMPISFKGRIVQQLGRITRTTNGETTATAHDFADLNVPVLRNMHARRTRTARKEGFVPISD